MLEIVTNIKNLMLLNDSNSDDEPSWGNPLQLLNAIKMENGLPQKGLMYVASLLNFKMVPAMMDTRAFQNFIDKQMIKPLWLKLSEQTSRIKAVNSQAQSLLGMAYAVNSIGWTSSIWW